MTSISEARCAEGWEVLEADGSMFNRNGDAPLQLQKLDEEALLDDDCEAHRVCVLGAIQGKEHCLTALQELREHSKPELLNVYMSFLHPRGGYTWEDVIDGDYTDQNLDRLEHLIFARIVSRTPTPAGLPACATPA